MTLFFLGIFLAVIAVIIALVTKKKAFYAGIILAVIVLFCSCITSVPTGHTGVVTTFGKVENYTLEAGVHVKLPWQDVVKMDNRTQKQSIELQAFSSDIQEVDVVFSLNYQINKENACTIYKTIGSEYYSKIIEPRIQEAVKGVFAKYTADNLVGQRDNLSTSIAQKLTAELSPYNIDVLNAAVENIDFSDAFTDAVEAKQVAEQNKLRAQTEQEQEILVAESEAKRKVIAAEAAAEVVKIEADSAEYQGTKDAAINKALGDTLTKDVLEYYKIQKWDGALPKYSTGEQTYPIFNMGNDK